MNNPDYISESFETIFSGLKYFHSLRRIGDRGWKKIGSGINIPDPQHLIFVFHCCTAGSIVRVGIFWLPESASQNPSFQEDPDSYLFMLNHRNFPEHFRNFLGSIFGSGSGGSSFTLCRSKPQNLNWQINIKSQQWLEHTYGCPRDYLLVYLWSSPPWSR